MRDKRSDNIPTTPLVTQHTHTGHHRGARGCDTRVVARRPSRSRRRLDSPSDGPRVHADLGRSAPPGNLLGRGPAAPRRGRDPDPRAPASTDD